MLSQVIDGEEQPVAYGSRMLSRAEKKYSVTRRELLAVVTFIKHFRPYLCGKKFVLRTDHASLRWLFNFKQPEGQIARWLELLASFEFDIVHRPGRGHLNADSLSRGAVGVEQSEDHKEEGNSQQRVGVIDRVPQVETWVPGCTKEQLREYQKADPDIAQMLKWKEGVRPGWCKVSGLSPAVKAYWFQWDQMQVTDELLQRYWASDDGRRDRLLLVVPKSMREDVMYEVHDGYTAAHLGVKKTTAKVRERYFWYKMRSDVQLWCEKM